MPSHIINVQRSMASQTRKLYGNAGSYKRSAHASFTLKTNQQMQIYNPSTLRVPYSYCDTGFSLFPSRAQTLLLRTPSLQPSPSSAHSFSYLESM